MINGSGGSLFHAYAAHSVSEKLHRKSQFLSGPGSKGKTSYPTNELAIGLKTARKLVSRDFRAFAEEGIARKSFIVSRRNEGVYMSISIEGFPWGSPVREDHLKASSPGVGAGR